MEEKAEVKTVVEHLGDLRGSLFRAVVVFTIGFFVCFHFAADLIQFLKAPLLEVLPENQKTLYYFGLTEQIYTYFKVAAVGSLVFTSPLLIWILWGFCSPALKLSEKKLAVPFIFFSAAAFILGAYSAHHWVLPYLFKFLIGFSQSQTETPMLRLGDYISLVLQLILATAVVFEIPVILALLGKMGIITAEFLRQFRPKAYVVLSILAAVITPTPDAFSMVLALIPLVILYEIGVGVVSWTTEG